MIPTPRRWVVLLILLGIFVSLRGYRSLEGDQAYRLPILLHGDSPTLYDGDPFVRSFDSFNPHRGALGLIGLASWPFGLSAGLLILFVLTLWVSSLGLDLLARAAWPNSGPYVGMVCVALAFSALAGNIGTNHLIEPILLDRQIAFALGWVALACMVAGSGRRLALAAVAIALAALVHPTLGLQIGLLSAIGWIVRVSYPRAESPGPGVAVTGLVVLGLALVPGLVLNLAHSGQLGDGVEPDAFRLLSVELQSPQHMLPHLWRRPQWLAWGCYPVLAFVSLVSAWVSDGSDRPPAPARVRVALVLCACLIGLGVAWFGIEHFGNLRLTLFQPFRMATVARGLSLVLLSDHWLRLWRSGSVLSRTRAVLLVGGLAGDWRMVVVTLTEVLMSIADIAASLSNTRPRIATALRTLGGVAFCAGVLHLSRHDTESGHLPILALTAASLISFSWWRARGIEWKAERQLRITALAWGLPLVALIASLWPVGRWFPGGETGREALVRRYRFAESPVDDVERLALWCRHNTPVDARFIGPPGPKTFRLWSRRSLAFNRAGSPYNARSLVDWAERFRDHVGFDGAVGDFVQAYLKDRHGLESGYERMSGDDLARLADRQGADYVVAASPDRGGGLMLGRELELVHAEGKLAVYQRVDKGLKIAKARR